MTDLLARLGVPTRCIENRRNAEENRRSIRLDLPANWNVQKVNVDGCWLTSVNQRKVDVLFYVVPSSSNAASAPKQAAVLVEFKGKDFGHALSQIEDTLSYLSQQPAWQNARTVQRLGIAILSHGNQIPSFQNKIAQLARRHNVIIRHKSKQMTITENDLKLL